MQTVRVRDSRPLTGDSMAAPRVVAALPFTSNDVSSRFSDKYLYTAGNPAAGVSRWSALQERVAATAHGRPRAGCL